MAETTNMEPVKVEPGRALRLWVGVFLPPLSWITQLQVLWLASEYGCATSNFLWNHVASVIALVFSIVGFLVAISEWRAVGGGQDDDDATNISRRRFMALIGILTGALFTTLIFAQWLPTLTGVPCDK